MQLESKTPPEDVAALRARCERLELLYQVGNVMHSTLDPNAALQLILAEAVRLMRATSGSVILVNPTSGFLEIQAAHGLPPRAAELKLRVGEGITGWVALTGKPMRVGDVTGDPRYITLQPNARAELAVPLEVEGQVRGVLNVDADRENAFSDADQQLLEESLEPRSNVRLIITIVVLCAMAALLTFFGVIFSLSR